MLKPTDDDVWIDVLSVLVPLALAVTATIIVALNTPEGQNKNMDDGQSQPDIAKTSPSESIQNDSLSLVPVNADHITHDESKGRYGL